MTGGRLDARVERATRELTEKHGYYYGGIHLGDYYNIQLMLDVARDMERICPDAWLIMSGNPVFTGCTHLTRETGIKVCGLCHGHYGVYEIARTIGLDPERVTWQAPGMYWLESTLEDQKTSLRQAKQRRVSYVATFEVLPQ